MQAAVGAGATVTVRPPVGEEWLITDFSNNAAFVGGVPDVEVSLTDGVNTSICLIDPTTDNGKRGRQYKFYITHDLYMLITNTGGAGSNIGWVGEKVAPNLTRSGIITIAALSNAIIQPPVGETWVITEWGADTWTAGPADINPDCWVGLSDGVSLLSFITDPTMIRGQDKCMEVYIDNAVGLNVYSTPGCNFAYSARRVPNNCISYVTDVAGLATLDVRPTVGEEWYLSEFSGEIWAGGGAPNNYPDLLISLRVGANLSDIFEPPALASINWDVACILLADYDHYIRITNNNAANNQVGVSGFLKRSY
jgi:hypothetical protein